MLVLYCHVDRDEGKVTKTFAGTLHFGPNVFSFAKWDCHRRERERSSHLCDQTRPTSRSTEQDKQTETSSVYGRGLPLAEVREKPWGEVTICNPEALRREDSVDVKVWQWLKDLRELSLILCANMCMCVCARGGGQDSFRTAKSSMPSLSPNKDT